MGYEGGEEEGKEGEKGAKCWRVGVNEDDGCVGLESKVGGGRVVDEAEGEGKWRKSHVHRHTKGQGDLPTRRARSYTPLFSVRIHSLTHTLSTHPPPDTHIHTTRRIRDESTRAGGSSALAMP